MLKDSENGPKLLPDYDYVYDKIVFDYGGLFSITRHEIGLWLLFWLAVGCLVQLKTMGENKTIFDHLNPSSH